ncbi:MAG: MlaD family protein [Verrucomicrobiales bacterium]|nr:MlaD family protein [Verrucomicrobiales bacterium]
MAIQDLTPQLRTRLSRIERVVGWFVILATALLLAGFGYYVYHVAQRKGWFLAKVPYFTYVRTAETLHMGDPVRLMGFDVGEIVEIEAESAQNSWARTNNYNIVIQFRIRAPYYGYILSDSKVKVASADLLGKRVLEVTRGVTGVVTVTETAPGKPAGILNHKQDPSSADYLPLTKDYKGYWIKADESPALTERLDVLAGQVQGALPSFFKLTNQISLLLSNSVDLTEHLDETTLQAQPLLADLRVISTQLTNGPGALGEWLLPPELTQQLKQMLDSANNSLQAAGNTLTNADTNMVMLATSLNKSLLDLANITSNLNKQVQANDQMLAQISAVVVHADELVQGLKRHWLLRSAFKEKSTNQPRRDNRSAPRTGQGR